MQGVSGAANIRVGLISSEPIRMMGLVSVFEDHESIQICIGDLETMVADESLRYLILDSGEHYGWMELQMKLRKVRPEMEHIIVGPSGSEEVTMRAVEAGARGYLDSTCEPAIVRRAVEEVIDGNIWAPRRVLARVIDRLMSRTIPSLPPPAPSFSPRERQVLDLIMTACSNREIAETLGIEERTVKAYVASLMRKTGADNRVLLSVHATQQMKREQNALRS